MAEHDDLWQGFVSSLVSEDSSRSGDTLSAEDAAWVDSCLVKDPELSDSSWNAMKDALIDILGIEPMSNTSASQIDVLPLGTYDDDIFPMSEEAGATQIPEGINGNDVLLSGEEEGPRGTDENSGLISEMVETRKNRVYFHEGFLLNPRDKKEVENADVGLDTELLSGTDLLTENIFRVWDLETIVLEEDELDNQLKHFFAESSLRPLTPTQDDSVSDLDVGTLDDIVTGMADLSLRPFSG